MSDVDELVTLLWQAGGERARGIEVLTRETDAYVRAPRQRTAMLLDLAQMQALVELQDQTMARLAREVANTPR